MGVMKIFPYILTILFILIAIFLLGTGGILLRYANIQTKPITSGGLDKSAARIMAIANSILAGVALVIVIIIAIYSFLFATCNGEENNGEENNEETYSLFKKFTYSILLILMAILIGFFSVNISYLNKISKIVSPPSIYGEKILISFFWFNVAALVLCSIILILMLVFLIKNRRKEKEKEKEKEEEEEIRLSQQAQRAQLTQQGVQGVQGQQIQQGIQGQYRARF